MCHLVESALRVSSSGVFTLRRLISGVIVLVLLVAHTTLAEKSGESLRDFGDALRDWSAEDAPGSGYAVLSEAVDRAISYIEDLERERSDLRAEVATLTNELESLRERLGARELISLRLSSEHLAATGYGEFQPLEQGDDEIARRRNRRIELKLTQR